MKKPKTKSDAGNVTVHFTLPYLPAQEVYLAGSFNEWQPAALRLVESDTSGWAADVPLPPGTHEYLFVVDGRWIADPNNPQTVLNPFGGRNSVIQVPPANSPTKRRSDSSAS